MCAQHCKSLRDKQQKASRATGITCWLPAECWSPKKVMRAAPHKSAKSNFFKNIALLEAIGFQPRHYDNVLPSRRFQTHHQKSLSQRGNKQKVSLYSVVACKGKQLRKFWLEVCFSLTIWSSFPLQQGAPSSKKTSFKTTKWKLCQHTKMHAYRHWRLALCITSLLS